MDLDNLRLEIDGAVARVIIDRPKSHNALDLATCQELLQVALHCQQRSDIRAIVLRGEAGAFCAGGDLASFGAAADEAPALLREMTVYLHSALSIFARGDAPVIAAVNGVAAGAGLSLVAAADLAIAAESARFTLAYTRAGLTPDGSSTWYLPRILGQRRTMELMLTNRLLSAGEALEWGLVNRVVADEELDGAVAKLAAQLASGPTRAFGGVKKLLALSATESLETQMEHESEWIASMAASTDGQEGIAAFLGKRPPVFRGE